MKIFTKKEWKEIQEMQERAEEKRKAEEKNKKYKKKLRLRREIKKILYKLAMSLNVVAFVYCGFFEAFYIIGLLALANSLYFSVKAESFDDFAIA